MRKRRMQTICSYLNNSWLLGEGGGGVPTFKFGMGCLQSVKWDYSGMVEWIFFPMLACLLLFYGLAFSLPAFIFRQFCYCVHECCCFCFFVFFAMMCFIKYFSPLLCVGNSSDRNLFNLPCSLCRIPFYSG